MVFRPQVSSMRSMLGTSDPPPHFPQASYLIFTAHDSWYWGAFLEIILLWFRILRSSSYTLKHLRIANMTSVVNVRQAVLRRKPAISAPNNVAKPQHIHSPNFWWYFAFRRNSIVFTSPSCSRLVYTHTHNTPYSV